MQTYYNTLFVTLDIGKNVNWFGAYAGHELKPVVEPTKVRTDQSGFECFSSTMDALLACGTYERLVLGLEPTGIYHEAWARALHERYAPQRAGQLQPALDFCFLNPLLSKRRREILNRGRHHKTDPIDLRAIAFCLRDGLGQPAFFAAQTELSFQLWGVAYRQTYRHRRRLENVLLAQLDRLWPGAVVNLKRFKRAHPDLEAPVPLVSTRALERYSLRAILQHCPNPHHFLALGPDGIQAFFRTHVGRCGPVTANTAYQVVKNAVLPPPPVAAVLAGQLQADFDYFLSLEQRFEALCAQAGTLVPDSPAAVLTSIPGLSDLLAARYLAHLGHPQRFLKASQIWSFAGFDPATEESGDFRRTGHITKKGEAGLRDTLFLIGFHTAQHVPAIARLKRKALARNKGHVGSTIHAAQKANRLCHHLLYHQIPFDPDRSR